MIFFFFRCFECNEKLIVMFVGDDMVKAADAVKCPNCSKVWGFMYPTFDVVEVLE
ncbi:hypothetical protein LCGC14_2865580 [marine sediment metagenome]|uniref:Uncharacterized protein n=1 Tax=marine sediment metagenome TaxID=412755 RepID=A0A0F9ACM4_9ZZZZ